MGNERNTKRDRGQLRQIAQEILPDLLTHKMFLEIQKEVYRKLEELSKAIHLRLDKVDEEVKEIRAFTVRQLAALPHQAPATKPATEKPPVDTL